VSLMGLPSIIQLAPAHFGYREQGRRGRKRHEPSDHVPFYYNAYVVYRDYCQTSPGPSGPLA